MEEDEVERDGVGDSPSRRVHRLGQKQVFLFEKKKFFMWSVIRCTDDTYSGLFAYTLGRF